MDIIPRRPSRRLTLDDAVAIWRRILDGEYLNRIAAAYDVNPGRISEIKSEQLFAGSRDIAQSSRHKSSTP